MAISENFLVNTKSFDPIIKALVSRSEHPEKISDTMLEEMGFDNPSDLLVLHVLRGLDIINEDRTPSDLYFKLVDPQQTKGAIAQGVINGYHELFEKNYDLHKMSPGELQEEFTEYFDGKKTDLIIKYIAKTFYKLITYAGVDKVEQARDNYFKKTVIQAESETDKNISGAGTYGASATGSEETLSEKQMDSKDLEQILFDDKKTEAGVEVNKDEIDPEYASEKIESEDTVEEDDEDIFNIKQPDSDAGSEIAPDIPPPSHKSLSLENLNTSNKNVQKAIIKRAELQYKLGHYKKALESIEEIIAYFDSSDEEFLKIAVGNAVIRRVNLLKKVGEDQKLLPALNEVISRLGDSERKKFYAYASKAMLYKIEILENKDYDRKDLLPLYNAVIKRLSHETDPSIQEKISNIFVKRLEFLIQSGDRAELLTALEESIERFKHSERFRKYLEEAMYRKTELLEEMNRNEEALEAYTAFLEEFGHSM